MPIASHSTHSTFVSTYSSPLGEMMLLATESGLAGVYFTGQRYFPAVQDSWVRDETRLDKVKTILDAWFAGKVANVDCPFDLRGSLFQTRVWQALLCIPPGEVRSYAKVADAIGAPTAVRAVSSAIGRNPISVLVPCHRVIGSDGALHGYAGGLDRKAWLLAHERRHFQNAGP